MFENWTSKRHSVDKLLTTFPNFGGVGCCQCEREIFSIVTITEKSITWLLPGFKGTIAHQLKGM